MIKIKDKKTIKGRYKITKIENEKIIEETDWINNLIVCSDGYGLNLIIKNLLGVDGYNLKITQARMGTDGTAPSDNDNDLKSPAGNYVEIAIGEEVIPSKISLSFFFTDADLPDGTYKELGLFCGNRLFARSVISPSYNKSINQDTRIDYEIEINN